MCLIYLAYRVHPRYPLVVAANRDEYHARASACAAWWEDAPQVLAGRDLEGGGTWMGVTRSGRFAAVTNYRESDPRNPHARTRGELVGDFLTQTTDAMEYLGQVHSRGASYNGFSLLVYDGGRLACCSNRGMPPREVAPGVHGLSNHLLDTPWPKVEEGKLDLLGLLARDHLAPQHLLGIVDQRQPADDARLPDSGIGKERERALSARFIVGEPYGTRCSTILLMSSDGEVRLQERNFDSSGEARGDAVFEFKVQSGERQKTAAIQRSSNQPARRPV